MDTVVVANIFSVLVFVAIIATVLYFIYRYNHKLSGSENKIVDTAQPVSLTKTLVGEQISVTSNAAIASATVVSAERSLLDKDKPKLRERGFLAVVGAIIAMLALKLWTLQILGNRAYRNAAAENMSREISLPAPRGRILDRNGEVLVGNRATLDLCGTADLLRFPQEILHIANICSVPADAIIKNLRDTSVLNQTERVIAADIDMRAASYISENSDLFAHTRIENSTVRVYPHGNLAAHTVGYVGEVTAENMAVKADYSMTDQIGKDGAELAFESYLKGLSGKRLFRVDSAGKPLDVVSETAPLAGADVWLTLDKDIQSQADTVLESVITDLQAAGVATAKSGALVCLDAKSGAVLASSSYPSFSPSQVMFNMSSDLWQSFVSDPAHNPMNNRAISGLFPAASTIKPFVGLAGMQNGIIGSSTMFNCSGSWSYQGDLWPQKCWISPSGHGSLGLEEAINQSCDIYFYNVGAQFYDNWDALPSGSRIDALQDYLRSFGLGTKTGFELPAELYGRLPNSQWKAEAFVDTPEEAGWNPGDMSNLCIGQGDLLVTPLQMAAAYATLGANTRLAPHVLSQVTNKTSDVVFEQTQMSLIKSVKDAGFDYTEPELDEWQLSRVFTGMRRFANRTSQLSNLPVAVAAKSGTAEVLGKSDFGWFCALAPATSPEYAVACVIEEGGGGSSSALFGVQRLLARLYEVNEAGIAISSSAER